MLRRVRTALTQAPRSRVVVLGVVLGAAAALAVVVVLVKVVPPWVASTDHLSGKDRAEEIGRARTAFLAILAGGVATVGAIFTGLSYRINRQGHELDRQAHELDRAGQITERFTRAIDQLGADKLDVRLGGIYALERIARDSADDHPQVMEVLTAYLRQHASWSPPMDADRSAAIGDSSPNADDHSSDRVEPPADVHGVVTVLGRRETDHDTRPLDLRSVDLRRARLGQGNLQHANLAGANLQDAILSGANLQYARLLEANLQDAILLGANLQDAILLGANLQDASLDGANLQDASLDGANLQDASLVRANLQRTNLSRANLQDAGLLEANLQDARLDRANLQRTNLSRANLEGAVYDGKTKWPTPDFEPEARARGARPRGARHRDEDDQSGSVSPPD